MTRATATTTRTVLVIWLTSIATVLLLFAAPVADAQSPATVPRIGYVWSGPPGSDPEEVRGFRQGLREVGYVEGRNLLIEYRYAGGDIDRVPQLIAGLLDLKVAILITPGTPVTAIAKREAGALPIVTVVNDPVGAGFAKSLARPGGTITGLSLAQDETFAGKIRPVSFRPLSALCKLDRQDSQGRETRRSRDRATYLVRAGHQREDCEGARADDSTVIAPAGGSDH
jgi:hypothetical protein